MTLYFAVLNACTIALFALMPKLAPLETPFGVRVPHERLSEQVLIDVRKDYLRSIIILAVLVGMASLLVRTVMLSSLMALLALPLTIYLWYRARNQIRAAKEAGDWFAGVSTAMPGSVTGVGGTRLPVYPYSWMGYLVGFVIILAGMAFIAAHWSQIPDVVATHWGEGLEPDVWNVKSIVSVFGISFVALAILALLALVMLPLLYFPVYARSSTSAKGMHRTAAALAATATAMGWYGAALTGCLSLMNISSMIPAYAALYKPVFVFILLVSVGGVVVLVGYQMHEADKAAAALPDNVSDAPQLVDNDQHFAMGMFYHNKSDPAILVDKRDGMGVDFNYAHWPGKIFIAVSSILILGSLTLTFIFV